MQSPHFPRDPVAYFVLQMARALHRYGAPAHRLEDVLRVLSRHFGTDGSFFSTPTAIMASFGPADVARTHLIRVEPGVVDLEGQVELDAIIADVLADRCSPEQGVVRLEALEARSPRYGFVVTTLGGGLVSSGAAVLFQGGVWDVAVAAVIGVVIGFLSRLAVRYERFGRVLEVTGAFVATLIATGAAALFGRTAPFLDILAGVIALLPGFTLTVALQELATRHLASGTARLLGALVALFQLAFGVAFGTKLMAMLVAAPLVVPEPLPGWTEPLAGIAGAVGFTILLRARPRDVLWVIVAAFAAIGGARFGSELLGPELGAFIGALVVSIGSNLRARLLHRTAAVTMVPGVILLVPGSIGFRSMSEFLAQDVVAGIGTGFSMFFVAISLVAGVLVANLLVEPRRSL